MVFHTLSLCAGVGGPDLGVRIARPDAVGVCYVEREVSAAAALVASMEAGRLHPAAVWSDLATFDARSWRGAVDCVLSGDPCQPNSVAGKRAGADDDRWLLDRVIQIFDESGASTLFRENVCGNIDGQLAVAIPALERLGCGIAVGIFSAGEAGASHRRERLFILARRGLDNPKLHRWPARRDDYACHDGHVASAASQQRSMGNPAHSDRRRELEPDGARRGRPGLAGTGEGLGHPTRERRGEGRTEPAGEQGRHDVAVSGSAVADAHDTGSSQRGSNKIGRGTMGQKGPPFGTCCSYLPAFAPGPADPRWPAIIAAAPSLEPAVCRMADGMANRVERLRHGGNGVVPLAAALAWTRLHALLDDDAARDAVRFADDQSARAGQAAVRAA